jgi:hypothetical protein
VRDVQAAARAVDAIEHAAVVVDLDDRRRGFALLALNHGGRAHRGHLVTV